MKKIKQGHLGRSQTPWLAIRNSTNWAKSGVARYGTVRYSFRMQLSITLRNGTVVSKIQR